MTIRSRLLTLLLPALTALIALIALFFYFNWYEEILNGFKTRLQSVVVATAQAIDPNEIEWIISQLNDPNLQSSSRYQKYRKKLVELKQQLPVNNLYIIKIESDPSKENPYLQTFLLDASHPDKNLNYAPGEVDYSETEEHRIYFTKKAFVTPIYESKKTKERFMSAYAPIFNSQGDVIALLAADVNTTEIDRKLHNALLILISGAFVTAVLVIGTVFMVANRISKPVQQLNQAALDIAAGNYEADIHVEGPKEIVELANTFNTMNECLVENMSRLRESSLVRERMYGEYECSLLLQDYMLKKVVEEFQDPRLQMRLTSVNLSNKFLGLLLQIQNENGLNLKISEATIAGFEGLYDLSRNSTLSLNPSIECQFSNDFSSLSYQTNVLFPPLVWSIKSQQYIKGKTHHIALQKNDMIFLYNSDFIDHFETEENIEAWFAKVLRHFAVDGLDTMQTMLLNELSFLCKKDNIKRNFQILSMQTK